MVNALDMAIGNRRPKPGGIVHADHGTQFTSWVFGEKIRSAGLLPSFGTIGDGLDNAMMESFWSSMQIELLDHNRQRRHSALGYRTRSNTNYPSKTTPSPPSVSHHDWNPTGRAGQDVTYPCSRPFLTGDFLLRRNMFRMIVSRSRRGPLSKICRASSPAAPPISRSMRVKVMSASQVKWWTK